jgi:hypothetical protein
MLDEMIDYWLNKLKKDYEQKESYTEWWIGF